MSFVVYFEVDRRCLFRTSTGRNYRTVCVPDKGVTTDNCGEGTQFMIMKSIEDFFVTT